jgi:hypothetical protein
MLLRMLLLAALFILQVCPAHAYAAAEASWRVAASVIAIFLGSRGLGCSPRPTPQGHTPHRLVGDKVQPLW